MPAFTKFYCLTEDLANAEHDFGVHTFKMLLTNGAPDLTDEDTGDVTEIAAGNGYTAGGATLASLTINETAGVTRLSCNDVTWTASGGSIGPARYGVIYNNSNTKLVCFIDLGLNLTVPTGQPLTIDIDPAEGFLKLQ